MTPTALPSRRIQRELEELGGEGEIDMGGWMVSSLSPCLACPNKSTPAPTKRRAASSKVAVHFQAAGFIVVSPGVKLGKIPTGM